MRGEVCLVKGVRVLKKPFQDLYAALFSFSMEKEMFRFVVLPCFELCRSNSFHASHEQYIYSTIFKTQERESDRSSKEIEQRKESQNTHKQNNKDM